MHVLIIPSFYPTPDQPVRGCFFREQAVALARSGLRVGVMAPLYRSPRALLSRRYTPAIGFQSVVEDGVATVLEQRQSWLPFLQRWQQAQWLHLGRRLFRRYVDEHGLPDLLHAHCALWAGLLTHELAGLTGIPYVITEHSTTFARGLVPRSQDQDLSRVYGGAAARFVVSPELGQLLQRRWPIAMQSWEWIPNLVSPLFEPEVSRSRSESAPFRFLNVALLTPKKGHDLLLNAFAQAFAGQTDVELCIGGSGPSEAELRSQAQRLGIASQVTFLGGLSRAQVLKQMQSADAFVLSSHYETFGVVLIEALACGLPVIATRCGGPECIVEPGDGELVDCHDVAALAAALRKLHADRDHFSSAQLRQRCLARFGEQAIADRLRRSYRAVLSQNSSGPIGRAA